MTVNFMKCFKNSNFNQIIREKMYPVLLSNTV